MAVNIPGVPFKLTPQDMGMPDLINAMQQGLQIPQAYQNILATQLANQKSQTLMPFIQPQAQAELTKAQQYNQYYPQLSQSTIGLQGAQTQEAQALASQHNIENKIKNIMLAQYKNKQKQEQQETTQPGQTIEGQETNQYQPKGPYGVAIPQPTTEDIMNKNLFGMDTYSEKYKNAMDNQQTQLKLLNNKSIASNQKVQANTDFLNQLSQYNNLMDQTTASGGFGGYLPRNFSSNAQEIENITAKMSLPAISSLRQAMGSGRFSIPEFTAALATKPQRTWNKKTREIFTEGIQTGANRDLQESQYNAFIRANPQLGIDSQTADVIWQTFQRNNPIISKDGKKFLKNNTIGQGWKDYLTPEAINSIYMKGDYQPKEIEIPKFESKDDFANWYNNLNDSQKSAYKSTLRK